MRIKRAIVALLAAAPLAALLGLEGCSPSTELGGALVPNALPDTRLTGQPPSLREADFVVQFYWTGSDPDGRVRGFQWKLSNNGTDGISVRDTLTVDPATGDTLNPWRFTTATDSTFVVTADNPGFPNDWDLNPKDQRSYQSHTLFVRAIDMQGGVDPTPAAVSFTATTLIPTIILDTPRMGAYLTAKSAPPTVTWGWTGTDPDFDLGVPTRVRYMWKPAKLPLIPGQPQQYVNSKHAFDQNLEFVCSFADSLWGPWVTYQARPEDRTVTFPNQASRDDAGNKIYYIFAVQAQDTAGAVSVDRIYARTVHNVDISTQMTPLLTVCEKYLGCYTNSSVYGLVGFDIAQGQPLEFNWAGTALAYAGTIVAYRYGWDVSDPTDPADLGWRIQPGNTPQHKKTPVESFQSGTHVLTVQCFDDSGQQTRVQIVLTVVPVPEIEDQQPLLLVDDVKDHNSQAWVDQIGVPRDNDIHRDAFWDEVLSPAYAGGVLGFSPVADVVDTESDLQFGYRNIVYYRNLLWTHKKTLGSFVGTNFDISDADRYIWLATYHQQIGNVFLCGQQSLQSFVGDTGYNNFPWMTPIIFSTTELSREYAGAQYALGFGARELPDGTLEWIGPTTYPATIWGVDAIDQPSHSYRVYPGTYLGQSARKSNCAGLKAIVLDGTFKSNYVDPGALADTIFTSRNLDYHDYSVPIPPLWWTFQWSMDEFYNSNITVRPTSINIQTLEDGRPAIEPMWRYYARFDWVNDLHTAAGDPGWPLNIYIPSNLRLECGQLALDTVTYERSRLLNVPCGFISHKTEMTKPGGVRPDVLWGFDPSRFDVNKIKQAIRWVLSEEFGLRLSAP